MLDTENVSKGKVEMKMKNVLDCINGFVPSSWFIASCIVMSIAVLCFTQKLEVTFLTKQNKTKQKAYKNSKTQNQSAKSNKSVNYPGKNRQF